MVTGTINNAEQCPRVASPFSRLPCDYAGHLTSSGPQNMIRSDICPFWAKGLSVWFTFPMCSLSLSFVFPEAKAPGWPHHMMQGAQISEFWLEECCLAFAGLQVSEKEIWIVLGHWDFGAVYFGDEN